MRITKYVDGQHLPGCESQKPLIWEPCSNGWTATGTLCSGCMPREETAPMTITEFLLARIAEDERKAGEVLRPWRSDHAESERYELTYYGFMADPAHVLAECEAKRRVVEDFEEYARDYRMMPSHFGEGRRHAALLAVTRVANIYADHPDYREEWRP